ncbi:hypothetical protein DY240_04170 [Jiangella rhizosphaerae]|uniref:Uncharacterized protein n=1 Tax=Jiangella rhizosphaerae TaxID=2293569 RepID=A0A418KVN9_9ACTN|nr:hypothetical protein DY240_04170 [Jiangella rhizosphaerae]
MPANAARAACTCARSFEASTPSANATSAEAWSVLARSRAFAAARAASWCSPRMSVIFSICLANDLASPPSTGATASAA